MGNVVYEESYIQNAVHALRAKNGSNNKYKVSDMEKKIYQLPSLVPFYHTEIPHDDVKSNEIASVANSYIEAIADGRLTIVYEAGYSVLSGANQKLRNEKGQYVINCSAFVGLILRGISYENSPYFDGDGSKVNARTDLFSWANSDYENANITEANQLAEYAFQNGMLLNSSDHKRANVGDVLFFEKYDNKYFGSIWHVAIVLEDGCTKVAHALNGKTTAIWTFNMNNPPSNLGVLKFIARPRYNIDFSKTTNQLKILEHPVDQYGKEGSTAVFKVVAQGEGLTYLWQYRSNANNVNWYNSTFAGYNTDTQPVEIKSHRNGNQYRCVITDADGNVVTSNPATIILIT